MRNSAPVWENVEAKRDAFVALADRVFDAPELLYAEHRAAAEHAAALEAEGFRVTRGVAGIPTAVVGEAGAGGPVIAILGEYDALPGLSQEPGVAEHRPVEPGRYKPGACRPRAGGDLVQLAERFPLARE